MTMTHRSPRTNGLEPPACYDDRFIGIRQVIARLERRWLPDGRESYSTDLSEFYAFLDDLGPGNGRCFVDLGCGTGEKLVLAYFRGFNVIGVEIDHELCEIARQLCPEALVIEGDADHFDTLMSDVLWDRRQ